MLKTIWQVGRREFNIMKKDVRALLILCFVPILYTLVFGYLYTPNIVTNIKTVVINKSPSQLSRSIVEGFNKSERFNVISNLESTENINTLLKNDDVDVYIVIPDDFTKRIKKGENSTVFMGVDASNIIIGNGAAASALQIVSTYSAGISIKKFEAKGQLDEIAFNNAAPISISFRPWFNPTYSYTNYLLLGIITVAFQQLLMMFTSIAFAREEELNTLSELLTYSNNSLALVLGKFLLYLSVNLVTFIPAALIGFYLYGIPLRGNLINILLMLPLFFICVQSISLIIAAFSRNQTQATQLAMLMTYPIFLLSGFTWPLLAMPDFLKVIAYSLPITYFAEAYRKIALMGMDFSVLKSDLLILAILVIVYLCIAVLIFQKRYKGLRQDETISGKKVVEC